MAWKNAGMQNITAKGLWETDIWKVSPNEALKGKEKAEVKFDVEKLVSATEVWYPEHDMRSLDDVVFTVEQGHRDSLTCASYDRHAVSPVKAISAAMPRTNVQVHWYGDSNVHGVYDVRTCAIVRDKEWIRDAYGIDHETETSREDRRYYQDEIKLEGSLKQMRPDGRDGSEVTGISIPYSKQKAPSGWATLLVPSEQVEINGSRVTVSLGNQDAMYRLKFKDAEGQTGWAQMNAADISHNVQVQNAKYRSQQIASKSVQRDGLVLSTVPDEDREYE